MLRINSQAPIEDKLRLADYTIDNNGSLENTKRQVKLIWKELAC